VASAVAADRARRVGRGARADVPSGRGLAARLVGDGALLGQATAGGDAGGAGVGGVGRGSPVDAAAPADQGQRAGARPGVRSAPAHRLGT